MFSNFEINAIPFYQIIFCVGSFLLSFLLTKLIIPFLSVFFNDLPNKRSSHYYPKPKAGGIVFVFLSILIFLIKGKYIFLLCLPIALIGLLDDFKELSKNFRLSFQIYIAYLFFILRDDLFMFSSFSILTFILLLIYIVIFVGLINSINFMDGIDGLVCSCMILIFFTISLKYDQDFLPITFILLGFLCFNWSPSKVFMGDIGSTFLGCLYASILFSSDNIFQFLEILALCSPILIDAFSCRMRMLIRGDNIFKAHKLHLYQRLHQAGLTHSTVSMIYLIATLTIAISIIFFNIFFSYFLVLIFFFMGAYLDKKIAKSF